MREPAYIALGDDGHVTLYWGDGTEPYREIVYRGPRPADQQDLLLIVQELKAWAEDNGFVIVVPTHDLTVADIAIEPTDQDLDQITLDDVDALIDDLDEAQQFDEPDIDQDTPSSYDE